MILSCSFDTQLRRCTGTGLLYGCETWAMRIDHDKTMKRAEMRMVRWMCGALLSDRLPSEVLRRRMGVEAIGDVIRRNMLRWYGHVERKRNDDWLKGVRRWRWRAQFPSEDRRRPGGPVFQMTCVCWASVQRIHGTAQGEGELDDRPTRHSLENGIWNDNDEWGYFSGFKLHCFPDACSYVLIPEGLFSLVSVLTEWTAWLLLTLRSWNSSRSHQCLLNNQSIYLEFTTSKNYENNLWPENREIIKGLF